MNSTYERLKAVIIALGYTSNEKFEDTVGLGHGFVSRITNRVSSKSLQAITRKFPQVNPSYIRTGMGEMFISSPIKVSENENAKTRLREYLKYKGITKREFCDKADVASNFPIIGKNCVFTARVSYAGYLSGYADDVYISSLPTIPIVKEDKEKYVAFEVSGDSMDDGSSRAYQNGDIVICKVCPDYMVKSNELHIDGKEYIIVHKEGILLKRIIDLDMNNGKLILRSFNPTYRDLELDLADVKQLLVVEYQQKRK